MGEIDKLGWLAWLVKRVMCAVYSYYSSSSLAHSLKLQDLGFVSNNPIAFIITH
jgi:hypothetical protein